jgi:hypothetical protein
MKLTTEKVLIGVGVAVGVYFAAKWAADSIATSSGYAAGQASVTGAEDEAAGQVTGFFSAIGTFLSTIF